MAAIDRSLNLVAALRAALAAVADPSRAPAMQAYMKSTMPYLGVSAQPARQVFRSFFADVPLPSSAVWQETVLELWRGATHREERYGAIWLTGDKRARPFQTPAALPMYEEIVVTGAWWDYVDEIATHRLGALLPATRDTMLAWSRSSDMWKRRSAIICQNRRKQETDRELLYRCIEPSLSSREFFLRKAIGWALRELAWTDPEEVVRYVRAHESELSGLSKREALKNVPA